MNIYVLGAGMAVLIAVRIGVIYPVATTIVLLAVAGVATALHMLRPRPTQLPPTRHPRRLKIDDTLG